MTPMSAQQAKARARRPWRRGRETVATIHEKRSRGRRDRDGHQHGQETSRLPFEQKKFDRQEYGGDRRPEDRRHAGGSARDEQRLAFRRAEPDGLCQQRSDGPSGHDDRALGAERAAGSDRDGRGQRLQNGDLAADPALADQDRLDGFGNAVPPYLFGPEARHQADDETPRDRDEHREHAERRLLDRTRNEGELAVVGEVGAEHDQLEEDPGGAGRNQSAQCGDGHEQEDAPVRREVPQAGAGEVVRVRRRRRPGRVDHANGFQLKRAIASCYDIS